MRTHLRIAAALFLINGLIVLLVAVASWRVYGAVAAELGSDASAIVQTAGPAAVALTTVHGVLWLVCSWGVYKFHRWARIVGGVLAALLLLQLPAGTIAGAYLLWVLLSARSEPFFDGDQGAGVAARSRTE